MNTSPLPGRRASRVLAVSLLGFALSAGLSGTTSASPSVTAPTLTVTEQSVTAPATALSKGKVHAPRKVSLGAKIVMEGKIPGRARRKVILKVKQGSKWSRVDTARTDRRKIFRLRTTAGAEPGREVFKVLAARKGKDRAVKRKVVVRVIAPTTEATPEPQPPEPQPQPGGPKGSPTDWTYLTAGTSMRWDACQAITWHYAPGQQPYAADADMSAAIAMVAARSGHTFTRVATADEAALDIKWATPEQVPGLAGSVIGLGGGSYSSIDPALNGGTKAVLVSGVVTLDATEKGHAGFTSNTSFTWGQVMLHEVMHSMGLGHAAGAEQIMFGSANSANQAFGAGDLGGLKDVGTGRGCINRGTGSRRAVPGSGSTLTWME